MYCSKCGELVRPRDKFCPKCGIKLSGNYKTKNSRNNKDNNIKTLIKDKLYDFTHPQNNYEKIKNIFIILIILFIIISIPFIIQYNTNKEQIPTIYSDFYELDLNGDGALSFDEAKLISNKTPENILLEYFNEYDENGNSLLKGAEYDMYRYMAKHNEYENPTTNEEYNQIDTSSSNESNYNTHGSQDHEEYDKIVGYDDMGYPIWVSYYYTSGNGNMAPGVYRYVGNEYSGYDIEYVSSDWQHEYQGNW